MLRATLVYLRGKPQNYGGDVSAAGYRVLGLAPAEGEGSDARAQVPSTPKRIRDTLSREEIRALEDAAELERDKLLVRVLADTGIRLAERLDLRAEDLVASGSGWSLKVWGKDDRERLIPLRPQLGRRLKKFIERTHSRAQSNHVWLTTRRSPVTGNYEALQRRTLQVTLKSLAELAGISVERVHAHAFRHSQTTELLRKGVSPIKVAELLGHRSLAMLMMIDI